MALRLLLALALAASSLPVRAQDPLEPPAVPGLAFPTNAAVREALGQASFLEYQQDLAQATGNPKSEEFQRSARGLAAKWSGRLYEALFPQPAERALLDWAAPGGASRLRRELVEAANAGQMETFVQGWRGRTLPLARGQLLRDPGSGRLKDWLTTRVKEDDLFSYYCAYGPVEPDLPARSARQQAERIAARGEGFDSAAGAGGAASEELERQCANWRKKKEWAKPAEPRLSAEEHPVPGPDAGEPKLPGSWAASLKRDAIAGAFGAAAFALIGLVLGGPLGAVIGAAAGFAVLAAVTHLGHNPQK